MQQQEPDSPEESKFKIYLPWAVIFAFLGWLFWTLVGKQWSAAGYYGWIFWILGIIAGLLAFFKGMNLLETKMSGNKRLGDMVSRIGSCIFAAVVIGYLVISCSNNIPSSSCTPTRFDSC